MSKQDKTVDVWEENVMKAFGEVLRAFRRTKKLTQEELGLEADVDRVFISRLESGLQKPSLVTLFRVAKVLGVEPHEFVKEVQQKLPQ